MIRNNNKIVDTWKCFDALLNKKTNSSPWSSWKVIKGYPESDVFTDLGTPIIFTESPRRISTNIVQQGGNREKEFYEIRLGVWDDRKTGGVEEINIISGRILDLFENKYDVHTATFDVTLGSAFPDTTLMAQGIRVEDIAGPREIATTNTKEFRHEFNIRIQV
jgi:hypothetical protein